MNNLGQLCFFFCLIFVPIQQCVFWDSVGSVEVTFLTVLRS